MNSSNTVWSMGERSEFIRIERKVSLLRFDRLDFRLIIRGILAAMVTLILEASVSVIMTVDESRHSLN